MAVGTQTHPKGLEERPKISEWTHDEVNDYVWNAQAQAVQPSVRNSRRTSPRGFNSSNFEVLKVIGQGSFAHQVAMVRHKPSGEVLAIKSMDKDFLARREDSLQYVTNEKEILLALPPHPFVVQCAGAFQTHSQLHIAMEYCPGGDLFTRVQMEGRLAENHARFYLAEVLVALEFLHGRDIVYRDLKPENILIDAAGHIRLTDFGFAKGNLRRGSKSYSFCGSPEYLAPEMLLNDHAHDHAVDMWAFGCLVYELLAGDPPFKWSGSLQSLRRQIVSGTFLFPQYFSLEARDLVDHLLRRDPDQRFCVAGAMEHSFFKSIHWPSVRTQGKVFQWKTPSERDAEHEGEFKGVVRSAGVGGDRIDGIRRRPSSSSCSSSSGGACSTGGSTDLEVETDDPAKHQSRDEEEEEEEEGGEGHNIVRHGGDTNAQALGTREHPEDEGSHEVKRRCLGQGTGTGCAPVSYASTSCTSSSSTSSTSPSSSPAPFSISSSYPSPPHPTTATARTSCPPSLPPAPSRSSSASFFLQELRPPFVPVLKGPEDACCFDVGYTKCAPKPLDIQNFTGGVVEATPNFVSSGAGSAGAAAGSAAVSCSSSLCVQHANHSSKAMTAQMTAQATGQALRQVKPDTSQHFGEDLFRDF